MKFKKFLTPSNIAFGAVFLCAAFLRLYRLPAFATFLGDQGRDAIIIKRIVTFEHLTAIGPPSSIGQVFLGPFYYYLVAPFLPLFQFNPAGLAFAVAFYSLIGFIAVYLIVKKEVNFVTAILFTILVAFSAVNIDLSRFSWNPNLLPIFAFVTLYFWYKTLSDKKWLYPFLFGIFFGCSFQLHHLALLIGAVVLVSFLIHLQKKKFRNNYLSKIGLSALGFVIMSSPLIFFDLKNHFLNTKSLIKLFTQGEILSDKSLHSSFGGRMSDAIAGLINHTFNITLPATITVLFFILFAGLCFFIYRKTKNEFIRLNILHVILFTVLFGLINSARIPHYYGSVYYSFLFVIAYTFSLFQKNKVMRWIVIPLLIVVYIAFNSPNYFFLYKEPNNQIHDAERIADSIIPHIDKTPYQIVPLPISITDGHIRYFLEIKGHRPLDYDSPVEGQELFAMCFYGAKCQIIGNPQWQIAAFKNPKIETMWKLNLVTIYKLVHGKK